MVVKLRKADQLLGMAGAKCVGSGYVVEEYLFGSMLVIPNGKYFFAVHGVHQGTGYL